MNTILQNLFERHPVIQQKRGRHEQIQHLLILLMFLGLGSTIVLPVIELLKRALQNREGEYIGLGNFITYFSSPSLFQSAVHTLTVASITAVVSVGAAFLFAYALERTHMKGKAFFTSMGMLPLFAPTMMYGIALIYLFGNNGIFTTGFFGLFEQWFGWEDSDFNIYGLKGIVISEIMFTFPQAFLILKVALSTADQRLYEAADTFGAGAVKKLFTITLPSIKYGLVSAFFVCFTLSFTDFGAPKVVGGQYDVLATDIYKQVIGQQNFSMGATVGIILTIPALIAFVVDQRIQRKQTGISAKASPYRAPVNPVRDRFYMLYCILLSAAILTLFSAIFAAAFVNVWPYDFSLTLRHFGFGNVAGDGLQPFYNSIIVSTVTAVMGTVIIFIGAYLIEKTRHLKMVRRLSYFLSILPIALPGLVIGLAFIFFFNQSTFAVPFTSFDIVNPFQWLYGTMTILVLANIVHFYSVSFITATTSLKKQDEAYEAVSETMNVPFYKTFFRVTVPLSLPAVLEMAMYLFVNSMTTISAVVFLYSSDWKLASIAVVNMNDAGDIAPAAAMSLLIVAANIIVRIIYEATIKVVRKRQQMQ
ncbi:putative 2-aminoethylphosphonate ABC transporter permease subunit [Salibacterium halotolerans]|uniref:Iron(III) transport system permease protein n=1 Tax=Salibacterium halotolerans TaxID=1884432 RepID=A0A1I5W090_9BACI|nr:putative 2-aminoethylphosphonate ABC transporter permease subunit [Salibacterium halotolerans]SFQ13208.1 iron(III) transport system permease protein [Salibacterium halotolerans]